MRRPTWWTSGRSRWGVGADPRLPLRGAGRAAAGLDPDCEAACRRLAGDDRQAAFQVAADACQAVAATMAKLRQVDAAWVAGDRSIAASAVRRRCSPWPAPSGSRTAS